MVAMPSDVLNGSGNASGDAVKALRADIKPLVAGTALAEGVTGQAAQNLDSQQSFNRADQIVLLAILALILILLLIIFRSPIIAVLPLIVIAVVSQVATGLISDVNKAFNLNTDNSISTILIVVLFGIGTDYILFLMFRYRERLRRGEKRKQAMVSAVTRVSGSGEGAGRGHRQDRYARSCRRQRHPLRPDLVRRPHRGLRRHLPPCLHLLLASRSFAGFQAAWSSGVARAGRERAARAGRSRSRCHSSPGRVRLRWRGLRRCRGFRHR
jgi:MMPL family protein